MGEDSPVDDLSEPTASTEKYRGLQVTVIIPSAIQKNLAPQAIARLKQIGQTFLNGILLEGQRLAAGYSNDLGFTITSEHISQAEIVERKRHQTKRDKWDHLQNVLKNLGWAGVGAAIGTVSSNLQLAFGLLLGFGALLVFARGKG